jgi:hypothetical protein
MREFQTTYDETTQTLINATGDAFRGGQGRASQAGGTAPATPPQTTGPEQPADAGQATPSPSRKEPLVPDWNCSNDLSNDDLKVVSYTIIFTKRDFEATLQSEKQEQVNWPTHEGGFGALKISDFMSRLPYGIDIPVEWHGGNEPPGDYGYGKEGHRIAKFTKIPQVDRKYIDIIIEVKARRPRADQEYDKDQARAQQDLARNVKRLADNL